MDGFEDRTFVADVARWGETKTTNETGTQIGENVSIQVGHDEEDVRVEVGVGGHLAGSVSK